jgi:polyhydroxybutyrate depolymerase
MRRLTGFASALGLLLCNSLCQAQDDPKARIAVPGDYRYTVRHGELDRAYRVHVPKTFDAAKPQTLIVALHGGGGSMDYQADDANYGLTTLSEREGAVLVFPNGYSRLRRGTLATWNAGGCCGQARDRDIDDVGFIRQVVANLQQQMVVGPNRVFATGMSNGAMMAYRLACEAGDVFSAIAAVAGTDNTRRCTPARPVSVLHLHARNDPMVPFDGGFSSNTRLRGATGEFASVPDTVARWVRHDACTGAPRTVLEKPGARCEVHASCSGAAQVKLCVTETGGHSWPGGQKARGEAPSQAVSANALMWEFFNRP